MVKVHLYYEVMIILISVQIQLTLNQQGPINSRTRVFIKSFHFMARAALLIYDIDTNFLNFSYKTGVTISNVGG